MSQIIFRRGDRAYSRDDIEQTAERHGHDGILFYPPSAWGTDDHSGQIRGETDRIYATAYQRGRERFRAISGAYPPTGDTSQDD